MARGNYGQTHLREVNQQRKSSIFRRREGTSSNAQQSASKIHIAECTAIAVFVFGNKRGLPTGEFAPLFHFIQMRLPSSQNGLSRALLLHSAYPGVHLIQSLLPQVMARLGNQHPRQRNHAHEIRKSHESVRTVRKVPYNGASGHHTA